MEAFQSKNWQSAYQICWNEFQDMHDLFMSSAPAFTYITAETRNILKKLQDSWLHHADGPIITMDAGPNIHLLYRPDQAEMAQQFKRDHLIGNHDVL
jgi:diphosphomevalonate decarboxylase